MVNLISMLFGISHLAIVIFAALISPMSYAQQTASIKKCQTSLALKVQTRNFESLIDELVALASPQDFDADGAQQVKNLDWKPLLTTSLLAQKRLELLKRIGTESTTLVFNEVHTRLNSLRQQKLTKDKTVSTSNESSSKSFVTILKPELKRTFDIGTDVRVISGVISPDGSKVMTTDSTNLVTLWSTESGERIRSWKAHESQLRSAQFSPDQRLIMTTANNGEPAKLWDTESGHLLLELQTDLATFLSHIDANEFPHEHATKIFQRKTAQDRALFSPTGNFIVTVYTDNRIICIWETKTGELRSVLPLKETRDNSINAFAISPDEKYLLVGSSTGGFKTTANLIKWDIANRKLITSFIAHISSITFVSFSADNERFASVSDAGNIKIWNNKSNDLMIEIPTGERSASFSQDGKFLLTSPRPSGEHMDVRLRDAESGQVLQTLSSHTHFVNSSQFSPDYQYILTTSNDGTAKLWKTYAQTDLDE